MKVPAVIVVTGTDTDIGKTVATAALAATLGSAGLRCAAYKPTQTGVGPHDPGDMAIVKQLTGIATIEGCRLTEPMAPRPAAAIDGVVLPTLADHLGAIEDLTDSHEVVLVEGAGGLLVELTDAGETLADLTARLPDAAVVLVARSALGTLNHTMLTREALQHRGIRLLGTVIGAWPRDPSAVEITNREYLAGLSEGLLGALPLGAPQLSPEDFRAGAVAWLDGFGQIAQR